MKPWVDPESEVIIHYDNRCFKGEVKDNYDGSAIILCDLNGDGEKEKVTWKKMHVGYCNTIFDIFFYQKKRLIDFNIVMGYNLSQYFSAAKGKDLAIDISDVYLGLNNHTRFPLENIAPPPSDILEFTEEELDDLDSEFPTVVELKGVLQGLSKYVRLRKWKKA